MQSDRIKNWPKDERPRERLLSAGADKLTEAELLAIILRVGQGTFKEGQRGQNASDFARTLLKQFLGLRGLDRAHANEQIEMLNKISMRRQEIARLKADAKARAGSVKTEVEEMILGTRQVDLIG